MIMKKIVLIIAGLITVCQLWAQDTAQKELSFIYIAHDENTDTQALIGRLKRQFENTIYYPEIRSTIFYLANGEDPIVVNVNTKDDNRAEFDNLIASLQNSRFHDTNANYDVERIIKILESNDIITDDGERLYEYIEWTYYVNSTFWQLRNNEHLIAKLYFILEMERLIASNYLNLNIYYSESTDNIEYNINSPFGDKNLCKDLNFVLIPY